jgi:lactoylglutathione lyase
LDHDDKEADVISESPVRELRLAVTAQDYPESLRFYRDDLGLPVVKSWDEPSGSGAILDAGRATLELLSPAQADLIDEVEVGRRVAGPVRVALEVEDSAQTARRLEAAGAVALGEPVETPWRHRNVRLDGPAGLQLTLFTILPGGE